MRLLELEGAPAWHASALAIGLHVDVAHTGVIAFWILAGLAVLGAFTPAGPVTAPRWLWAIPILLALSVVFVNVETPRFREPIEPVPGAARRLRGGERGGAGQRPRAGAPTAGRCASPAWSANVPAAGGRAQRVEMAKRLP